MADLQGLQIFAEEHGFDLTRPLTHEQVEQLAKYWFPEMRFYQKEKFHPISLDEDFSMVECLFNSLPPNAQDEWRVNLFAVTDTNGLTLRAFDPPVVHIPAGVIQVAGQTIFLVRVLNDGTPARDALSDPAAAGSAVITHGASFTRSNLFFGATTTVKGGAEASAGDPFLPRATLKPWPEKDDKDGERPLITVMASLKNLLDLLKYELIVSGADDYPPDGLRGGFNIAGRLLRPVTAQPPPLSDATVRKFLLDTIATHESGGDFPPPPFGWDLDRIAWDAVTRYAFLEYDFFYAYNDFDRHSNALFANEHEADTEGCCLVFERNVLNLAATSSDPDALLRAVPHSIITSVHEEFQDADIFKFIAPPVPSEGSLARDDVTFRVYVAAGSHATYLTSGTHDLVDFQDYTAFIEENPAVLLLGPALVPALIILAIIEHFTDTEDLTSDDGVRTGPEEVVDPNLPTAVANRLIVIPMSADNHIYDPKNEELLRLRAFAGKWGGHDGFLNKSPAFKPKTARYFRKLLSKI